MKASRRRLLQLAAAAAVLPAAAQVVRAQTYPARPVRPVVRAQLTGAGTTPMSSTPAEFRAHIAAETEKWGKVIKLSGAKPE